MANLDTRNKRASALMLDLAFGRIWPNPDGTIDGLDRQQAAYKYEGISAAAAVTAVLGFGVWFMSQLNLAWNIWQAVTKSDIVDLPEFQANNKLTTGLYIGTTGDVVAVEENGTAITFVGVPAGQMLPISVRRVNSTNTTASNIVALYSR